MLPLNPWEHQNAIKTLYAKCVEGICITYQLTRMELDILLFLANHPRYDTATDIVEIRYLSKSQVSSSIRLLEQRGFLRKEYTSQNRKSAHLKLCNSTTDLIRDGRSAQEAFLAILLNGFTKEERNNMREYNERIQQNIRTYFKEENHV